MSVAGDTREVVPKTSGAELHKPEDFQDAEAPFRPAAVVEEEQARPPSKRYAAKAIALVLAVGTVLVYLNEIRPRLAAPAGYLQTWCQVKRQAEVKELQCGVSQSDPDCSINEWTQYPPTAGFEFGATRVELLLDWTDEFNQPRKAVAYFPQDESYNTRNKERYKVAFPEGHTGRCWVRDPELPEGQVATESDGFLIYRGNSPNGWIAGMVILGFASIMVSFYAFFGIFLLGGCFKITDDLEEDKNKKKQLENPELKGKAPAAH